MINIKINIERKGKKRGCVAMNEAPMTHLVPFTYWQSYLLRVPSSIFLILHVVFSYMSHLNLHPLLPLLTIYIPISHSPLLPNSHSLTDTPIFFLLKDIFTTSIKTNLFNNHAFTSFKHLL